MTRLEMIKNAVNKVQGNPEFKAQMKKINQKFIKDCEKKIARLKAKQERQMEKELSELDENYNSVDVKTARTIADTAVGEIYRETTRFDNEWN